MQVVEKFVINKNDLKYIYVETLMGSFATVQYRIYHNLNTCEIKSVDDFNVTYGVDEEITLFEAVKNIDNDIIEILDDKTNLLLDNVKILKEKLKNSNKWNPSLWGYKETFLSSLDIYNELIDQRKIEQEDYERDYNRLKGNDIEDILERIRN